MGTGFQDAMPIAAGNTFPVTYLPSGLPGFAPPRRHPLQDALDEIMRIYEGFAPRPSDPFVQRGSRAELLSPIVGQPLSWYAGDFQSPDPAMPGASAQLGESGNQTATESPLGSSSVNFAQLDPNLIPPTAPERPRLPDYQGSSLPSRSTDQGIIRVSEDEPSAVTGGVQIAQQDNKTPALPARRGIAPNVELPPGTPLRDGPGQPVILPDGSRIPDRYSATGDLMSPVADLADVAAAGRETARIYRLLRSSPDTSEGGLWGYIASFGHHVGHGGLFDYQRGPGNSITGFEQRRQFRNVSNVNVGLFGQQAGLTLDQVLANAGTFASWKSSNAKSQEPYGLDPQTREFIELGYKIGERGVFGRAEAP